MSYYDKVNQYVPGAGNYNTGAFDHRSEDYRRGHRDAFECCRKHYFVKRHEYMQEADDDKRMVFWIGTASGVALSSFVAVAIMLFV